MATDLLGYDKLVEGVMRDVVRGALIKAAKDGLPGAHHFYITFRTQAPGVEIAHSLLAQYPSEMTIALQHQFWDLKVDEDGFRVMLSFNKMPQQLIVPFSAMTTFTDPSVGFALQFGGETEGETQMIPTVAPSIPADHDKAETSAPEDPESPENPEDKVVTLDAFRKK